MLGDDAGEKLNANVKKKAILASKLISTFIHTSDLELDAVLGLKELNALFVKDEELR